MASCGAHRVLAFSENPTTLKKRMGPSDSNVEILHEQDPPFSFEAEFFEAIICLDLESRLSNSTEGGEWLEEIRRILKPEGTLIVASSQSSYQELHAQIQPHFSGVTLVGQFIMQGHLFRDFGSTEEEPGLTLNRTLLTSNEEPQHLVMVFGPHSVEMDDLVLIQLPTTEGDHKEAPSFAQVVKRQEKELSLLSSRLAAQELQNAQLLARHNSEILRLRAEIDSLRSLAHSSRNGETELVSEQLELYQQKHQAELGALQTRYQVALEQADRELATLRLTLEEANTGPSSQNSGALPLEPDILATATYGMIDTPEISPTSGQSLETSFRSPNPILEPDKADK